MKAITANPEIIREIFAAKNEEYKKSTIQDALDLLTIPDWTPETLDEKQEEKIKRLLLYFDLKQ